jgi:hypothetical protein
MWRTDFNLGGWGGPGTPHPLNDTGGPRRAVKLFFFAPGALVAIASAPNLKSAFSVPFVMRNYNRDGGCY